MNEREVAELRRRFRQDRSGISHVRGCYVNENREIVSQFDQSLGVLTQEENEKYTRVSVIPLNAVTDYDYFSTCLYRSLHAILPTNLVKQKHQLVDVPTLPLNNP